MTATISKGTLNLRFMQNALRAKQELDVESAETVASNDESQWEVAKEVRDMWGITSEPSSSSIVTHEASYLPFVLSPTDASGSPPLPVKLRGRRTWNKRGQEVMEGAEHSPDDSSARPDPTTTTVAEGQQQHHHPTSKRLTSISSFGPGSSKESKRTKSRSAKSARELIREVPSGLREIKIKSKMEEDEDGDSPSPTDRAPQMAAPLPSSNKTMMTMAIDNIDGGASPPAAPTALPKFLKPAGVDDPPGDIPRRDGSRPTQREAEHGTDGNSNSNNNFGLQRRQNPKRDRDDRHEIAAAPTADRKKRKKSGAAAAAAAAS